MKPNELDIVQWQELLEQFWSFDKVGDPLARPAMRCENSQLTLGWKCGGFTINGHAYTAFCPRAVHGPCAMLAVRDDFLRWVVKYLKEQGRQSKLTEEQQAFQQSELGLILAANQRGDK